MYGLLYFIIGICIGSFANVVIFRVPKGESIVFPNSHCTSCGSELKPYDLIPIISYIIIRGKCRYCGERISIKYPITEAIFGLLFLLAYLKYGNGYLLYKYLILISIILIIGLIDLYTTNVYSNTIVIGIMLSLIFIIIELIKGNSIVTYILGAGVGGLFIYLIILITKGMGEGDIEIIVLCGLYLGFKETMLVLFLSFIIGGLISIILILTKIKSRKDYIPFGQFISIATLIVIFFGQNILKWYLN